MIRVCKAEAIYTLESWRPGDPQEYATHERVEWFNHRLLLESLGNTPSGKHGLAYPRPDETQTMAA